MAANIGYWMGVENKRAKRAHKSGQAVMGVCYNLKTVEMENRYSEVVGCEEENKSAVENCFEEKEEGEEDYMKYLAAEKQETNKKWD